MKNLILFLILSCLVQLTTAQTKVTDISQPPLQGKVKEVTTYTYRGQNHETVDSGAEPERTVETFDEKGRPTEETFYSKDGSIRDKLTFTFFGDSVIVANQIDREGKVFVEYIYKYNSMGVETEFDMEAPERPKYHMAKIDYKCLLKYDDAGNRISEDQYINKTQVTYRTTSVYNKLHEVVQSVMQSFAGDKVETTKMTFTYDSKGNQIKTNKYDTDGRLTEIWKSSFNKFDNHGNWLIRISSTNGHNSYQGDFNFVDVTKRVIKYY